MCYSSKNTKLQFFSFQFRLLTVPSVPPQNECSLTQPPPRQLATAEDDRLIYPVQQDYVEHAGPVWNAGNHTDINNNNSSNWDEKTRVLGSSQAQCDNSTCDKPSSLFPALPSFPTPPTSSPPCSPGSLCRHSYCKCKLDNISTAHLPIQVLTAP